MKKTRMFALVLLLCAGLMTAVSCNDARPADAIAESVDVTFTGDAPQPQQGRAAVPDVDSADKARARNLVAQEEAQIEFLPETGDSFNPAQNVVALMMGKTKGLLDKSMQHGFLRTAENLGYPSLLLEVDGQDTAQAQLQKGLDQGMKGMLVVADLPEIEQIIPAAKQAGVKVVETHLPTDATVDAILAADPLDYAAEAASQMCEEAMRRGHKEGKILIVGNDGDEAIGDAFIAALRTQYPQFLPVTTLGGQSPENYVKENPDLAGILALKDGSPQDWNKICTAVSAQGKIKKENKSANTADTGKRNPVIIGLDYTQKNIASVKNAEIYALIARPFFDAAAQSMATLDRLLRELPIQTQVRLNAPVIRKKDIEKYDVIIKETINWFTPTKTAPLAQAPPSPPPAQENQG